MKITPTTLTTPDGHVYARADLTSHIEHVTVPWNRYVRGQLAREQRAIITSILAPAEAVRNFDLGELRFIYNDRTVFSAPVQALRNRYHGLMHLHQLTERFRLLFDPDATMRDLNPDEDLRPLGNPIHVQELLGYRIEHDAPTDAVDPGGILVELQYFHCRGWYSSGGPRLFKEPQR